MAIKVSRTHGLRVVMEKCGCKATREYEDPQLTKPLGDTPSFIPCEKHSAASSDAVDTIEEILFEMLETAAIQAAKMVSSPPVTPALHSVKDVAANAEGHTTSTPIKKLGVGGGRTMVRRSGSGGAISAVSTAVQASRAAGSTASIDAELARAPEPAAPPIIGVTREKVLEVMEEASDSEDPVTPLDVILGANDPSRND